MEVNHLRKIAALEKRWITLMLLAVCVPVWYWWRENSKPQPLFSFNGGASATPTSVAMTPDGAWIACAFSIFKGRRGNITWSTGEVRIYNAKTGQLHDTLFSGREVYALSFSRDGRLLRAVEGESVAIRWWDWRSAQVTRRVQAGTGPIAVSPDENYFVHARESTSDGSYQLMLRNARTGNLIRRLATTEGRYESAVFSGKGDRVMAIVDEENLNKNRLREWTVPDGKENLPKTGAAEPVSFVPAKNPITFKGVSVFTQGQIQSLENGDFPFSARDYAFSRDENLLAIAGDNEIPQGIEFLRKLQDYQSETDPNAWFGRVSVWNLKTKKMIWDREVGKSVVGTTFSPDSRLLALVIRDSYWGDAVPYGHVEVWLVPT